MMLLDTVKSKLDNVIKYIFRLNNGEIVEFSYIDNGTGKDIICVSCQTMCNLSCKFCHCTDYIQKVKVFSLSESDIFIGVSTIIKNIPTRKETLLISYMGCGEPFNVLIGDTILFSMKRIRARFGDLYKTVKFGLATCLPANRIHRFMDFCFEVKDNNLPVKLHLSLHYTDNEARKECMPSSLDIQASLAACKFYKEHTGNQVELHYTLVEGINDTYKDARTLGSWAYMYKFNVKLITYNEKETLDYKKSQLIETFQSNLECDSEIYTPPGRDIGSSCGQFLFETYQKYKG